MQIFSTSYFLYNWARDMILFSFDQKYESINENEIENRLIITALVS